jgi:predicted AAA+ superfamily ATPase
MSESPPFIRRHLTTSIEEALQDTPAVLVVGPRQAGKTTLCLELANERDGRLLSLDDGATLAAAVSDPHNFVEGLGDGLIVIDEVQRAPELMRAIKLAIDRRRH